MDTRQQALMQAYEQMKQELEAKYMRNEPATTTGPKGGLVGLGSSRNMVIPELRDKYMAELTELEDWAKQVGVSAPRHAMGGLPTPGGI